MQAIDFNIIREDILNQVEEISSFSFVAGESRKLAVQVLYKYNKKPQPVKAGWLPLFSFATRDMPLYREGVLNSCEDNNSIVTVDLTGQNTKDITSGYIWLKLINTNELDANAQQTPASAAYDAATGEIAIDDSVDLTSVEAGHLIKDDNGFRVITAIRDEAGNKAVFVEAGGAALVGTVTLELSTECLIAIKQRVLIKEKAQSC